MCKFALMKYVQEFFQVFWNISLEMAPWLLLGLLFAGILHVYLPSQFIYKQLGGKSLWNIVKAILLGVPLPLCSCGVLPAAVQLDKDGASKPTTNAFLISTPQTGVDSIFATYAMLGLPFAIVRPIIAMLSGLFGGLFTAAFDTETNNNPPADKSFQMEKLSFQEKLKKVFQYGFIEMMQDIGKWIVIGLVLATLVTLLIPDGFFSETVNNYYLQMLLILLISLPLYVCATGSIPIAMSLLMKGLDPSLIILFLMAGPATNIASVALLVKTIGQKTFNLYLISIILSALFFTLLIHYTLPTEWFLKALPMNLDGMEMHHASPLTIGLTLIFFILLIYANFPKNTTKMKTQDIELEVTGMTCNHCKVNVENNLKSIEGTEEVEAQPSTDKVYIKGNPDIEKVKSTIRELGYEVKE